MEPEQPTSPDTTPTSPDTPPGAPALQTPRDPAPTSAWVSLGAALSSGVILVLGAVLVAPFGVAAGLFAVIAGMQDAENLQAKIGIGLGFVFMVLTFFAAIAT